MSLELGTNALELLDDSLLDRVSECLVVVGEDLGLVANFVENLLPSTVSQELVTLVEPVSSEWVRRLGLFSFCGSTHGTWIVSCKARVALAWVCSMAACPCAI